MVNEEAAQARKRIRAVIPAAILVMGAWCGPAVGSSGIDIQCPETASARENPLGTLTPSLASHNDAALEDILDDTALTTLPALAETANETVIEEADDVESADEDSPSRDRTPAITTRLPGVPESSLPSFRRQMHRTDI